MAILITTNPRTIKYLTWVATTLAYAYSLIGVPDELCRGDSVWLQEQMANVVCSVIGYEILESDEPLPVEQIRDISRKVIRYAAGVIEGKINVEFPR